MNVLAIGAHPDDIELGCGGALLAHKTGGDRVVMLVMTEGEQGPTGSYSRRAEQEEAAALLGAELLWGGFDDCRVPEDLDGVTFIEAAIKHFDVDVVYTHTASDTHQDHRATATATMAAARRLRRVLCYEAPSTVGFKPTVYVDVAEHMAAKLDILRAHMSQVLGCGLVDLDAVEAQTRFRGFQARVRHAEAFEVHRFLWTPTETDEKPSPASQWPDMADLPSAEGLRTEGIKASDYEATSAGASERDPGIQDS